MKMISLTLLLATLLLVPTSNARADLKAGTAIVDVTPVELPVLVNGGMRSRSADEVHAPLYARAIVLDDDQERLGIVVVDSCMMPRSLLDEAKRLAAEQTEMSSDGILISATHSHTAPASMGCLGTDADSNYVPFLRGKLVEVLVAAEANLVPARVGWASANAAEFTATRRWIRRPDRMAEDPFGNRTVRANMHAARDWDDVVGEAGPEDPELSLISFQAADGRPLAVLANFSMHYFGGVKALSPDYFGLFCEEMESGLTAGRDEGDPPFVAIMSHGCSGDIWRRDYSKPADLRKDDVTVESYAKGLARIALDAYEGIVHREDADLAMREARLNLKYRVPDQQRLEWAQRIVDKMGDRLPKSKEEIYAREQVMLHQRKTTEIVIQAIRIGDVAIATTPNETYALTGLKLKRKSPLSKTMVIELANGGDGYIPPPEQHLLGGYNTWPARSAGLEIQAEPKITETALQLLEQVAGQPRRVFQQSRGPACQAIVNAEPEVYWRLDELSGPFAVDLTNHNHDAFYEPAVVFFLEGPRSERFCTGGETNRAAHFAGGRLRTRLANAGDHYSVSLWFWNGMPIEARKTTGWMFSRGRDHGLGPHGDHLGIGGTASEPGKLVFLHGAPPNEVSLVVGRTAIKRWTWYHAVFVRDGERVRVYLNGESTPEIDIESPADFPTGFHHMFFGGRCDRQSNWEGRLDEIALFNRALSPAEIEALSAPLRPQ
ncbi:MAG: LamG-like jellyroll fold domain-containing protein [Planctomycetota bacterium]